jgi:hypothetical protein
VKLVKGFSLLIVLLLSAVGFGVDSFDYHCANIALMTNRSVQDEIGITADQRAKMNKFADGHRARLEAYDKKLRAAQKPADAKVMQGYLDQLKKEVTSVMSAAQIKRLRELNLQAAGLLGLTDKMVALKIGMSETQANAFRQAYVDGKSSAEGIVRSALLPITQKYQKLAMQYRGKEREHEADLKKLDESFKAEAQAAQKKLQPRVDSITQATQKKLTGLITPQQKATWMALQGKRFVPKK